MLHEFIDMGTEVARAVHKQVVARADEPAAMTDVRDAAVAFDRLSRAVRRTVALARHVAEPVPARADPGQTRAAARRRIIREVEDAIQRAPDVDADALRAELCERLDRPELDEGIDSRPVAEVIADICRDLGFGRLLGNHPWKRRRPEDIPDLSARAARLPGSPPCPAPSGPAQGWGETWRPQPFTEEGATELMHKLLELRPPRIRGL